MPKAKLVRGQRLTKPSPSRKKRQKKDGRPKGTLKRFKFEETRLGFFLKYEVPVVYDIIRNMTPPGPVFEPPYLLIRIVCGSSSDPSLRKRKFFRYLEEYERLGLYCKRAKKPTPERMVYYRRVRERKMSVFIKENKKRIEAMVKTDVGKKFRGNF